MKAVLDIGVLGMTLLLRAAAGMELEARDFREVARRKGVLARTLLLPAILPLVLEVVLALTVWAQAALAADPANGIDRVLNRAEIAALGGACPPTKSPPGCIRRDPRGWSAKFPNSRRVRRYPRLCWIVPTKPTRTWMICVSSRLFRRPWRLT